MKKMLTYSLLATIFIINSGAGCGSNNIDPQPDNFSSILGKWEAVRAKYEITKQDGSQLSTGPEFKSKGVVIIWEFFKDGKLKATMNGKTREVRWELNVTRPNGKGIKEGKLKIIGDEERELAQSLGQTGDLTHDIEINAEGTLMYLKIDATSQGPYKKNILVYTYAKM